MNDALEQLDALIAQKRQELKDLLFARDAIGNFQGGAFVAHEVRAALELTDGGEKDKKKAKSKPGPKPGKKKKKPGPKPKAEKAKKTNRLDAIKQSASGRRSFTNGQKVAILDEYRDAARKRDVLEKYKVSPSCITNWGRKRTAGKLNPSAGEIDAPSLDLSAEDEDGKDEVEVEEEPEPEEESDLVSELAGPEAPPPSDPFIMGEGRRPNFPDPI